MIAVIPARGNSKAVRRKNLAVLDGKPLLCHIADTLECRVVVSTEDPEIRSVALCHGYEVVDRPRELAGDDVTVAAVAEHVCEALDYTGPVLIAQPTVPFVRPATIQTLVSRLDEHTAATLIAPSTHLRRSPDAERINRQWMNEYHEVGVRAFRSPAHLHDYPTGEVVVEGREAIDIDTYGDLAAARQIPRSVMFEAAGNTKIGSGHIRRCIALAAELHHDITFHLVDSADWAYELVEYPIREIPWPPADLVVIDTLDTTVEQVARHKTNGSVVVTLEDRGPGAKHADLVVNALYPTTGLTHEVSGPEWADLRPEFIGLPPFKVWQSKRVLVLFGGTDPAELGDRVVKLLQPYADVTWIRPGDNTSVAWEMMNHDLLVTSAGRTVYEAAAVGIPSVVLAQNNREATHLHLGPEHGNIYLGLGRLVSDDQIVHTVTMLLDDADLRHELSQAATVDGLGLARLARRINELLEDNHG